MSFPSYCVGCGEEYGKSLFLWLPNEHWKYLGYKEDDYVCAHCIIDRVTEKAKEGHLYMYHSLILNTGYVFPHKTSIDIPKMQDLPLAKRHLLKSFK